MRRAIGEAFPDNDGMSIMTARIVGADADGAASCAVCGRALAGFDERALVLEPLGSDKRHFTITDGTPGAPACCLACARTARELFGDSFPLLPAWSMVQAELERLIPQLDDEVVTSLRAWIARRPELRDASCSFCGESGRAAASSRGAICDACSGPAFAAQWNYPRSDKRVRCPSCKSIHVGMAEPVGIEFTKMSCDECGNTEICDTWQLDDWVG